MTKDNHLLGRFELSGIPPAPRGVPQIEVTFQVDSDGILHVFAEEKGTGKSEQITISGIKGRLSEEEIKSMVAEAEIYEEEDRKQKGVVDARNGLESYLYNLRRTLEEDNLATKLSAEDSKDLHDMVDDSLDWLESNSEISSAEEFQEKQKEVEQVAAPILRKLYSAGATSEDEHDFDDGDL